MALALRCLQFILDFNDAIQLRNGGQPAGAPCRMAFSTHFCDDFGEYNSNPSNPGKMDDEVSRRSPMPALTTSAILPLAAPFVPARAAQKLRVAKVVPFAWTFTPLDIGIQEGIFAKQGLDVEASASAGDAKLQQLLASGSVDIGIGSGPGMAFSPRARRQKAVAEMYGAPRNMAVMVGYDFGGQERGRSEGQKTRLHHGRLADRLDRRSASTRKKAGAATASTMVPIGGMPPARAAIKTHQIDGYIGALETGYKLEEAKEWRVITSATPFVDHFITHVIFATQRLDRQSIRTGARLSRGLVRNHRLHEVAQGRVGRNFRQGDRYQPRLSRPASMTSRSAASRPMAPSTRRRSRR